MGATPQAFTGEMSRGFFYNHRESLSPTKLVNGHCRRTYDISNIVSWTWMSPVSVSKGFVVLPCRTGYKLRWIKNVPWWRWLRSVRQTRENEMQYKLKPANARLKGIRKHSEGHNIAEPCRSCWNAPVLRSRAQHVWSRARARLAN